MKLISCDHCGVVLDQDKLNFPKDIWDETGFSIDESKADYNQLSKGWEAFIPCPVCNKKVYQQ